MVQLTTEQKVFIVTNFICTQSVTEVQNAFRIRFPDRNSPVRKTILDNVRNQGNSGRRRTGRSERNAATVRARTDRTRFATATRFFDF